MKKKKIQYVPLILVELYLIMTLLLMEFGPLNFNLQNKTMFWGLIFMYHIAFIVGYIFISIRKKKNVSTKVEWDDTKIQKIYWGIIIVSFLVWMVVYRNGTHANSYIPYELPKNFITGLIHPAERYYWKLTPEALAQHHGNKLITGIASLLYPAYYCLPSLMIFLWDRITKAQKIVSYIQIFLMMAVGISVGTNKYLFDVLFLIGGAFILELVSKWNSIGIKFLNKRKIIIFTIIFLIIFDICYFTYGMRERTGNVSAYVGNTHDDITLSHIQEEDETKTEDESFLNSMLIGLSSYICQGYYGFSLALDEEFTTTYGLGHSEFCISTIKGLFGIDLGTRTYQEKITKQWSRTGNWHSFYSQMSNDVGFYGVILIMLIIGMVLAQTWKDAYTDNNIVAKCLLMLFVIMFLYMPANNQVGNSYGTFFAFWELMVIWTVLHIKKMKEGNSNV